MHNVQPHKKKSEEVLSICIGEKKKTRKNRGEFIEKAEHDCMRWPRAPFFFRKQEALEPLLNFIKKNKEQSIWLFQETKKVKNKIAKITQGLLSINLYKGDQSLGITRANSFLKTALHLWTERAKILEDDVISHNLNGPTHGDNNFHTKFFPLPSRVPLAIGLG